MDLLLKESLLAVLSVVMTEEADEATDALDPFLSLKKDKSLSLDLMLLILNTFRSLFENDTFELVDTSDTPDWMEDAIEGRLGAKVSCDGRIVLLRLLFRLSDELGLGLIGVDVGFCNEIEQLLLGFLGRPCCIHGD